VTDRMPSAIAKSEGVVEPRIIRGEIPEPGRQVRRKKRSPFERHIELAKEFPARWDAAAGEYKGGWIEVCAQLRKGDGPKARQRAMALDRRRLQSYLESRFPLDRFQIANRTDPGTWCDLRMYVRFLHTLSPEDDARDRAQRRRRYEAMMARRAEVAAQRELENRRSRGARG
jgi:hypothetical protein